MTGRRIVVTLGRDGTVRAETVGIQGQACLDAIPLLEDLLDAEAIDSSLTADYYVTDASVDAQPKARLREELDTEERG
jgi:hypothetical protein